MDVKLFGIENLGRLPENGDLVAGVLAGRRVVGLAGEDQEGRYVLVLSGDLDTDEAPPVIIAMDQFEGRLGVIEGEVSIEPTGEGFSGRRVDRNQPGALLVGGEGGLGIAVKYRQSVNRFSVFHYSLETGGPLSADEKDVGIMGWRLVLRQEGRREPFELARF